jgi:hypothetical protein
LMLWRSYLPLWWVDSIARIERARAKESLRCSCIEHKGLRAACLPWRSEEVKVWSCHVNKRYKCACKCDV